MKVEGGEFSVMSAQRNGLRAKKGPNYPKPPLIPRHILLTVNGATNAIYRLKCTWSYPQTLCIGSLSLVEAPYGASTQISTP